MAAVLTPETTFQTNLRRLREARGLTKYRLAKLSGVDESTLCRYENGERASPAHPQLTRLAHALNVTIDELVHGEDASDAK